MTQQKVHLTVITPVVNSVRYINRALENVTQQQCGLVEHVVIDGGSTDGTVEVIREYSRVHPHVRWISEPDDGQSDAMNKGIALAEGTIISFLNVDDFYEPNIFEYVIETFKRLPKNSLLVGDCKIWDAQGNVTVNRPSQLSYINVIAKRAFPMNPSSYFYHKAIHDVIGPYRVGDHYSMDVDFIIRATKIANVVYEPRPLGNFRYFPGTKTFQDVQAGLNWVRTDALFQQAFRSLPPFQKGYVLFFTKVAQPLMGKLRRLGYYSRRPSEIPGLLKRSWQRLFSA